MIPRWKFILYSLLGMAAALFSFALLVFVGSLILFVLTTHGFIYLPLFQFGELVNGIRAIPILLFLLTIVLIVVLELLVRNYAFSFRKPIVTTLFVLTLSAIFLSYLLTLTPVHKEIRQYAKKHQINFVSREYERPLPLRQKGGMTVIRGIVIATSTGVVVLQLPDDSTQVVFASTTSRPFRLPDYGQDVVVFGRIVNDKFEALDIRTSDKLPF